jgi:hypothetical protein
MKRHDALLRIAVIVALLAALIWLPSCGAGAPSTPTTNLAVADSSNSRVVIYNAPLSMDESASVVLGKSGFTQPLLPCPVINASTLCTPSGLAKDSAGNLYVADTENNRVLRFRPPFVNGMDADLVVGQPGFASSDPQISASGTSFPTQVAIDGNGNLWVVDNENSRVLEFTPPFSNGMAASLAIGQTSTDGPLGINPCNQGGSPSAPTASSLCGPMGISFDPEGNLWVSDYSNSRVLEFKPPFSTGMAASLELGQPAATAFTSEVADNGGVSARSLCGPYGAPSFDSKGDLWVADNCNNRVLEYVPPFSNGMAASKVLGQMQFAQRDGNQGRSNPAANTINFPRDLTFDVNGNLSVADSGNSRILIFLPPFSTGMSATIVLGQQSFAAGQSNQNGFSSPAADTLWNPSGLVAF